MRRSRSGRHERLIYHPGDVRYLDSESGSLLEDFLRGAIPQGAMRANLVVVAHVALHEGPAVLHRGFLRELYLGPHGPVDPLRLAVAFRGPDRSHRMLGAPFLAFDIEAAVAASHGVPLRSVVGMHHGRDAVGREHLVEAFDDEIRGGRRRDERPEIEPGVVVHDRQGLHLAARLGIDPDLHEVYAHPLHRARHSEPLDVLPLALHHGLEAAGEQYLVGRGAGHSRAGHQGYLPVAKVLAERPALLLDDGRFGGLGLGARARGRTGPSRREKAAAALLELEDMDPLHNAAHLPTDRPHIQERMAPVADELVAGPQQLGCRAVRIAVLDKLRRPVALALPLVLNLFKALLLFLSGFLLVMANHRKESASYPARRLRRLHLVKIINYQDTL